MLETLDLDRSLEKSEYKARLPVLQARLHQLQRACWKANLGTLVVFEGWGASGKGSVIRKLTQKLEPRGFSLHAIQEALSEASHHFWFHILVTLSSLVPLVLTRYISPLARPRL